MRASHQIPPHWIEDSLSVHSTRHKRLGQSLVPIFKVKIRKNAQELLVRSTPLKVVLRTPSPFLIHPLISHPLVRLVPPNRWRTKYRSEINSDVALAPYCFDSSLKSDISVAPQCFRSEDGRSARRHSWCSRCGGRPFFFLVVTYSAPVVLQTA